MVICRVRPKNWIVVQVWSAWWFSPNSRALLPTFHTNCPDGSHFAQMGSHFAQDTTTNPCSLLSRHTRLSRICTWTNTPKPTPKQPFSWPELESGQNKLQSGHFGPQLGKMFEKWANFSRSRPKKIFISSCRGPKHMWKPEVLIKARSVFWSRKHRILKLMCSPGDEGWKLETLCCGLRFSSIFDNSRKNEGQALLWLLLRGSTSNIKSYRVSALMGLVPRKMVEGQQRLSALSRNQTRAATLSATDLKFP